MTRRIPVLRPALLLAPQRRKGRKYGRVDLLPADEFEWGVINGKLSALRWDAFREAVLQLSAVPGLPLDRCGK
jgi:hypothetical protein